jgi:hypothetical protein
MCISDIYAVLPINTWISIIPSSIWGIYYLIRTFYITSKYIENLNIFTFIYLYIKKMVANQLFPVLSGFLHH